MPLQFWFWLIWLICVVFGGWTWWPAVPSNRWYFGAYCWVWVLLAILGWHVFGNPFHALVR